MKRPLEEITDLEQRRLAIAQRIEALKLKKAENKLEARRRKFVGIPRKKPNLEFVAEGEYAKREEKLVFCESLNQQGVRIDDDPEEEVLAIVEEYPEIHWFDAKFLDPKTAKISTLIHHPKIVEITELKRDEVFPLTKRERRRLKRQRRATRVKEMQDRERMGLEKPPVAKLKMSNILRVAGDQQVSNPTLLEIQARSQTKTRFQQHMSRNERKKLTEEEKRAKKIQSWRGTDAVEVCVYKVEGDHLEDKRLRFLVDVNARQLHLTGFALIYPKIAQIIVIEGSPRASRKFARLLQSRVKWETRCEQTKEDEQVEKLEENIENSEDEDEESEDEENELLMKQKFRNNQIKLLWCSSQTSRQFDVYRSFLAKSEFEVDEFLKKKNARGYWKLALENSEE